MISYFNKNKLGLCSREGALHVSHYTGQNLEGQSPNGRILSVGAMNRSKKHLALLFPVLPMTSNCNIKFIIYK